VIGKKISALKHSSGVTYEWVIPLATGPVRCPDWIIELAQQPRSAPNKENWQLRWRGVQEGKRTITASQLAGSPEPLPFTRGSSTYYDLTGSGACPLGDHRVPPPEYCQTPWWRLPRKASRCGGESLRPSEKVDPLFCAVAHHRETHRAL
jgi:hypothetical protein